MDEETEVAEAPEVEAEVSIPEPKDDSQDRNWRQANRVMSEQQERIQQLERMVSGLGKPHEEEFSDEEPLSRGEYKKLEQQRQQRFENQAIQTAEQIFAAENPDYRMLMKTYLQKLVDSNPKLAKSLEKNPDAHEVVYKMIKESAMYQKDQKPKEVSSEAKKILKNASQPVSGNAVGKAASGKAKDEDINLSRAEIIAKAKAFARGQVS